MSQANQDAADPRINPLSIIAVPLPGPERDEYLAGIADAIIPDEGRANYFGDAAHRLIGELLHATVAKVNDRRDFSGLPDSGHSEASIGLVAEWIEESTRPRKSPDRGRDSLAFNAMEATGGRATTAMTYASMGEREASGVAATAIIALWKAERSFGETLARA